MPAQRAYRLTVGNILIDASDGITPNDLRVAFRVERDTKKVPNDVRVVVYNLNEGNREGLTQLQNVSVHLEAGYVDDGIGTLFLGDLRSARTTKQGPDYVTTVDGGDGENGVRVGSFNRSFVAGTPIGSVIRELAESLGLGLGNAGDFANAQLTNGSATLKRPLTVSGPVYYSLDKVCNSCGLSWSIQDSAVQINELDRPLGAEEGPLVTPTSGLIGVPEIEIATKAAEGVTKGQTVVSAVSLLRTDIIPGRALRVESQAFTGDLVCRSVVHEGDSHAERTWVTSFTGVPY